MTLPRFALPLILPLLGSLLFAVPASAQDETMVFLVRHAERADDGAMTGSEDPHLSRAGLDRAEVVAHLLQDAGITHVHSTHYRRTRETALPLARLLDLDVATYDADNLEVFAETLRAIPGRHLVVGHSDTTPALVSALGGHPGGEIRPLEYDRLYLLRLGPGGTETVLLRFGSPFEG